MKRKLLVLKMLTLALDELIAEGELPQWSRVVELTLQYGKSMNVEEYELLPFTLLLDILQTENKKKINTPSNHISLTHDFRCPKCKGEFFGSSDREGVTLYHCHTFIKHVVDGYRPCHWSGLAEECFTVPKK